MTYGDVALRLPSASARWRSPAFREELRAWVSEEVGEPTSLEPVKSQAWASVWRAETPAGVHFAKQNCATQSFEAAVLAELNELAPHHVVPLTAVDLARGLLMTPDQGPVMAKASYEDLDAWCRVVAAGASLPREVTPYVDRLAAAGLDTLGTRAAAHRRAVGRAGRGAGAAHDAVPQRPARQQRL